MTDLVNGDRDTGGSSSIAAVAGYPSITLPAGAVYGLPVGVSFIGRAWSEPVLIRLAFGLERALAAAAGAAPPADGRDPARGPGPAGPEIRAARGHSRQGVG